VTRYVAQRLIERERALAGSTIAALNDGPAPPRAWQIARTIGIFILGIAAGIILLLVAAYIAASGVPGR